MELTIENAKSLLETIEQEMLWVDVAIKSNPPALIATELKTMLDQRLVLKTQILQIVNDVKISLPIELEKYIVS